MKRYHFIIFTIIYIFHNNTSLNAQVDWGSINYSYIKNNLKVPASPSATAFTKFGAFKVGHYTGSVQADIPLFKAGDSYIGMDVSLNYASDGMKLADVGGWTGVGWNMSAGGVITRTVRGNPDESNTYYWSNVNLDQPISNQDQMRERKFLDSLQRGFFETQPDIYSVNAGGVTNSFIIKKDGTVIWEENKHMQVTIQWQTGSNGNAHDIAGFTVTDKNGYQYQFGVPEKTSYTQEILPGSPVGYSNSYSYNSAWYLTMITHPSYPGDNIQLTYTTIPGDGGIPVNFNNMNSLSYNFGCIGCPDNCGPAYLCNGGGQLFTMSTSKIEFRKIINKVMHFKNSKKRQEIVFTTSLNNAYYGYGNYKIDKVNLYDMQNPTISQKEFQLNYSTATRKLFLIEVIEKDYGSTASLPPYKFEYDLTGVLFEDPYGTASDFWGYYRPGTTATVHGNCNGCGNGGRDASSYSQGVLKKMTFPTGGYQMYEYEGHQVEPFFTGASPGSTCETMQFVGGLRIKKINNFNMDGIKTSEREYRYVTQFQGFASSGKHLYELQLITSPYQTTHHQGGACLASPMMGNGCPNCYAENHSYNIATMPADPLKIKHVFAKGHVGYSRVEELINSTTNSQIAGITAYEFHNQPYVATSEIRNGELKSQEEYRRQGQGSWSKIRRQDKKYYLDYTNTSNLPSYHGIIVVPEVNQYTVQNVLCRTGSGTWDFVWKRPDQNTPTSIESYQFLTRMTRDYQYFRTKTNYLTTDSITTYESDTKYISQVTNFAYDYTNHSVPTEIKTKNSDNVEYKIVNSNIVYNEPREVAKYLGDWWYVYAYKINYGWLGGYNLPVSIQDRYTIFDSYETVEQITARDDKGNVIEAKRNHDQENTYIWDNDTTYMTCFARNAKVNEVRYSSFERTTSHSGGWDLTPANVLYSNKGGAAGNGYYQITTSIGATQSISGVKYSTGIPAGKYVVSYYVNNPTVTNVSISAVAGTVSVLKSTISPAPSQTGYYQVEHIVNMSAGARLMVKSATSPLNIDELRLYPIDALMQTFTYDSRNNQLTCVGDESGRLSRFEYDSFQRLIGIYNHDDHLIKTHEYNYANVGFTKNSLVDRAVLLAGQTNVGAVSGLASNSLIRTYNYFDGLGREIQAVQPDFSPSGNDVVKLKKYDIYGRDVYDYLPYTIANTATSVSSIFRPTPETEQSIYWNGQYSGDGSFAFTENISEFSPLERVTGVRSPGAAFSSYPTNVQFKLNDANEVRIPTTLSSFYNVNTLFKNETTDEDGKKITTYTDKVGRKVMEDRAGAKTYFIYNAHGKIMQVIQPEGSALLGDNNLTQVLRHSFRYTYDNRGRLTNKKIPGTDGDYIYHYDRLDRVVLETDPKGFKTFTKYDILGRVIQTGKYTGAATPNAETLYENRNNTSATHFYTNTQAFPTSSTEIYNVTYYDDYDFNNDGTHANDVSYLATPTITYPGDFATAHPSGLQHLFTRGKPTSSKTGILQSNGSAPVTFSNVTSFYDKWGRTLQTQENHPYSGQNFTWTGYHFAGWPLRVSREHRATVSGVASSLFTTDRMLYDHSGRVTHKYHKINNNAEILVSQQTYNETDQVITKTLGTTVQTINYTYNVRGWLRGINEVVAGNDLFFMKLSYESPHANVSAAACRNGNISSIEWNKTGAPKSVYGFQYDALNRMTHAIYGEGPTATSNPGRYNETLTYNLNGDINTLQRWGKNGGTPTVPTFGQIDNLTYAYTSSGAARLSSVTDGSNTSYGFATTSSNNHSYSYDANGNLNGRTNTGYNTITYNHLNLPHTISGTGGTITNVFDAGGRKWQSTVGGVTTTYFGDIEYEGNAIKAIYHQDGRILNNSGSYEYQYYIKDHLGNVRIVCNSSAVIQSEQHYYPFGLNMEGNFTSPGYNQKYRYNGKELYGGLGWYDYGARYYDPAIGKFTGVDAWAEKYYSWSPYNYTYNNPIMFIDPTGNGPTTDYYNQKGKKIGTDGVSNGKIVVVTDKKEVKNIENTNKSGGTTSESTVKSGVTLPSAKVRSEMGKSVSASNKPNLDDKEGGFHEEGGVYGKDINGEYQVRHAKPGPFTEPDANVMATIDPDDPANPNAPLIVREGSFHVHPRGTRSPGANTLGGVTKSFNQSPTDPQDFLEASRYPGNSYVLGAKGTVTIYNGGGILATFPLNEFIKIGNE